MLQIFPFLTWTALVTSAVLLGALWASGELGRGGVFLLCWFLVAGAMQFLGTSAAVSTTGLVLETGLAVYLLIRWKATA